MITVFCPQCFKENSLGEPACQWCGSKLQAEEGRDYVERLIRFSLKHPLPEIASQAARILGRIGDLRAAEALRTMVQERKEILFQEAAIEALGHLKDAKAIPYLRERLCSGPFLVRSQAARALGQIGGKEAIEALTQAASSDPSETVRSAARNALCRSGLLERPKNG